MPGARPTPPESGSRKTLTLDIAEDQAGQRLDKALSEAFPDLSRSRLGALIGEGAVTLNGKVPKPATKLHAGDRVELVIPPAVPSALEPERGDLRILHEDDSLLVVAKPAGVVVHPGAGEARGTLAAFLLEHCGRLSEIGGVMRPGIVHRLDKGTSGLMVVAKNDQAHRALSAQFKGRIVTKIYTALCLGAPRPARGSIRLPIGRDPRHRQRMGVVEGGREAHTDYEVTELLGPASVVRLTLHTGRTHQIRVHLAALHCPLVGDSTYGASPMAARAPIGSRALLTNFPRPALHAQVLGFTHPVTGEAMRFEEQWPEDLEQLRGSLRAAIPSTNRGHKP